jgi:hypothetical protein
MSDLGQLELKGVCKDKPLPTDSSHVGGHIAFHKYFLVGQIFEKIFV